MTPHDTARFARCITTLAVATRGELDEPTITLYYRALEDVPMDLVEAAAVELAKTSQWFPRPAEWREAVDTINDLQRRLTAAGTVQLLPGSVDEWICPMCENTGWVQTWFECKKNFCRPEASEPETVHTHEGVIPCSDPTCQAKRASARMARRRYSKRAS